MSYAFERKRVLNKILESELIVISPYLSESIPYGSSSYFLIGNCCGITSQGRAVSIFSIQYLSGQCYALLILHPGRARGFFRCTDPCCCHFKCLCRSFQLQISACMFPVTMIFNFFYAHLGSF